MCAQQEKKREEDGVLLLCVHGNIRRVVPGVSMFLRAQSLLHRRHFQSSFSCHALCGMQIQVPFETQMAWMQLCPGRLRGATCMSHGSGVYGEHVLFGVSRRRIGNRRALGGVVRRILDAVFLHADCWYRAIDGHETLLSLWVARQMPHSTCKTHKFRQFLKFSTLHNVSSRRVHRKVVVGVTHSTRSFADKYLETRIQEY